MQNFLKTTALAAMLSLASNAALAQESTPKLPAPIVSEDLTIDRKDINVLGSTMSYLEQGTGAPVLFIHGNPTSAYLWRNVMPYVSDSHRAIAIDLIGMGHSAKPDIEYTFDDHYRHLEAFVEEMELTDITLVAHDWGASLAWEFARRNPEKTVRIAFMEGVLPPAFPQASFEAMGEQMGGMFRALKDPEQGYQMVMENNMFVEQLLPSMANRPLGDKAKAEYGAPYRKTEDRLPTWVWPKEVPIGGQPASTTQLMADIQGFMGETTMPVLLTYAEPGVLVPPAAVPYYTGLIPNIEATYIGQGLHYIQEDQPDAIGRAIADWLRRNS